ncbi:MAG TPA: metallophosphoesterase family protein [Nitrososphaerales archaeon]|nr:metallophosphoesterase family protein [Nitrososphaerales archaeon]
MMCPKREAKSRREIEKREKGRRNLLQKYIEHPYSHETFKSAKKTQTIRVSEELELVSPFPAAYVRKHNALIVSDVHLGLDSRLAMRGTSLPGSVYRDVADSILIPTRDLDCSLVYILGDLKHGHGKLNRSEEWEVRGLVQQIRAAGAEPILVKGNHDRFLNGVLSELRVAWHEDYVALENIILTHGDKKVNSASRGRDKQDRKTSACVMGHEHPAVSLRVESNSRKEKFKAFLVVPGNPRRSVPMMVVLPSVNPLAYGTEVNGIPKSDFISPYLREASNLWEADTYLLEVGQLLLRFPKLGLLRSKS